MPLLRPPVPPALNGDATNQAKIIRVARTDAF